MGNKYFLASSVQDWIQVFSKWWWLISLNKCMLIQWSGTLGHGISYFISDSRVFSKTQLSMGAMKLELVTSSMADSHASPPVACRQALDMSAQITVMELSSEQMIESRWRKELSHRHSNKTPTRYAMPTVYRETNVDTLIIKNTTTKKHCIFPLLY